MRRTITTIVFSLTIFNLSAQDKKQQAVEQAVASFRQAIIDGDSTKLDQLTDSDLSYGHSLGKIENKQQFVHALASGESDFKTMDVTDQTIVVKNKTAVVRHKIAAEIKEKGNFSTVKLAVMMVFHKDNKQWKLLARQAIRL
jgi:ketosteroid isomerase-like protein